MCQRSANLRQDALALPAAGVNQHGKSSDWKGNDKTWRMASVRTSQLKNAVQTIVQAPAWRSYGLQLRKRCIDSPWVSFYIEPTREEAGLCA